MNFFSLRSVALNSVAVFSVSVLLFSACSKSTEPSQETAQPAASAQPAPAAEAPVKPLGSKYAVMKTSKGVVKLKLYGDQSPRAVGNFMALANGTKPWTDPRDGQTKTTPLYNGTIFHRVIPGFMVQGGDPMGDGRGGPGYRFQDEFDPSLQFNRPGLLAMANSGPNTNGSQFFITDGEAPWLNNRHTIFGEVTEGMDVVKAIVAVPRRADDGSDRPLQPVYIESVTVSDKP